MRAFTTKGGQIFEVWESRKEALHDVADIIDGIRYAIEIGQRTDDLLWVQYKDGSHYCISEEGEEGKFKKINIEAIIDENYDTTAIQKELIEDGEKSTWQIAAASASVLFIVGVFTLLIFSKEEKNQDEKELTKELVCHDAE